MNRLHKENSNMNRKIILNLAISLDGYIASEDGGFDWIVGDGNHILDTPNQMDFTHFLEGVDTIVMGKRCYEQNFHQDYPDKKIYVATSEPLQNYDNIHFISGAICEVLEEEKKQTGKDIFLFGGGGLVDHFVKADLIDEYIIGIIPTLLGKGRPLFLGNNPTIHLTLKEYSVSEGITILKYTKRLITS